MTHQFYQNELYFKSFSCNSLTTYVQGFLSAGFRITGIVEPTVTPEQLNDSPQLDDELRVPNFIIYHLSKP